VKGNKILKFPKQCCENIGEDGISNSTDFDEYEDWEDDYYYFNKGDWNGLVKYREQRVKNYPEDLDVQWQLGEAYVFNNEFEKALKLLEKLYYKDPHDINVKHSILDALFGLNKTENDFNWIEKPMVLRLNLEVIDICYNLLKSKRKPKDIYELYIDLMVDRYLTFQENDLLEAILKDDRFIVEDEYKLISGKYVSIIKNKKK
jgi:tetratricopeptide (TPR) repeat protein